MNHIGSIDHFPHGNVHRLLPGRVDLPEPFASSPSMCHHCGESDPRQRTHLFEDDGNVVAMMDKCALIEQVPIDLTVYQPAPRSANFNEVLRYCIAFRKYHSWISAGEEKAGAGMASARTIRRLLFFSDDTSDLDDDVIHRSANEDPDVLEKANAVAEWVWSDLGQKDAERLTGIETGIYILYRIGLVEPHQVGLACSAIPLFDKYRAEAVENEKYHHIGQIKERREFMVRVVSITGPFPGTYGDAYVCAMETIPDGQELAWWTGENLALEEGMTYRIKGTITKHVLYRGRPQTNINRVKVVEDPV